MYTKKESMFGFGSFLYSFPFKNTKFSRKRKTQILLIYKFNIPLSILRLKNIITKLNKQEENVHRYAREREKERDRGRTKTSIILPERKRISLTLNLPAY